MFQNVCSFFMQSQNKGGKVKLPYFVLHAGPGKTGTSFLQSAANNMLKNDFKTDLLIGKNLHITEDPKALDKDLIDYEEVEALALEHKPKLIIAGASAYPRVIDWKKFRDT